MNKASYIAARLAQIVPTFILIGIVVFVLVRILPGGPVAAMLGDKASDEAIARITSQMGLDASIPVQFWRFLETIARGDLGELIVFRVPVAVLVADRLPVTLLLSGLAILIALSLAVPLAFVAATNLNRWPDLVIRAAFQVGLSSPIFYVGLVLLTVLSAGLHLFPVGGYGETAADRLHHLLLPALTLALSLSAVLMRNLRASVIEVLNAEFVEFARAKGLARRLILGRHVLRNALIAIIALMGPLIGELLGGAVITESVFAVPGVGRLMVDSIFARDYPVIQGLTLVLAVLVSLAFLLTDLTQMALDPRVAQ